jgi:DNA-binding IscR family transcriptional regulator
MEPLSIECIFGDPALHARFSIAIDLMARLVMAGPEPLTGAMLAAGMGQPARVVRAVLSSLRAGGLVYAHPSARDVWACAPHVESLTLADVFRSIADAGTPAAPPEADADDARRASRLGVNLLLMQATMAINQVVQQHLQTFDLGRLRALGSAAGFPPFAGARRHRPRLAETA